MPDYTVQRTVRIDHLSRQLACPCVRPNATCRSSRLDTGFHPVFRNLWNLCNLWILFFCFCFATGRAAAQKTPPAERITDHLVRIGKALVDTQARTITCPAEINMDSGSVEYLAVAPRGKTHESLLLVDVQPLHLQLALLVLGLEPKNVLRAQGDRAVPQGAPVEIRVRWRTATGKTQEARAETLLAEMDSRGNLRRAMPPHNWVFTGSRIVKEGFEADLEKSLVAIWHDPAAILDNPLPEGGNNDWVVNSARVPKRGTTVEFIIRAVAPSAGSGGVAQPPGAGQPHKGL
jgi:hypothetical protein